jgi:hypothetical protein
MISNERSYARRPHQNYNNHNYNNGQNYNGHNPSHSYHYGQSKFAQPKAAVVEDTLKCVEVQIERKNFILTLKENPRGRFLRITEDVGGRRDTIIIPSTGLSEFKQIIDEMLHISDALPVTATEDEPQPPV